MTALKIFATAKPMVRHGPLQPMSREDARFWELRRQYKQRENAQIKRKVER